MDKDSDAFCEQKDALTVMIKNLASDEATIICRMHFNAAHRLHNPRFSHQKNRKIFGKCNNKNWHGHNYIIEVFVKGPINPATGFVINLVDLKAVVEKEIIYQCDHKNLNLDVPWLKNVNPTAENLAVAFWQRIKKRIHQGRLYKIRLIETENNIAEYSEADN